MTATKCGRRPAGPRTGRNFWCVRIAVTVISSGSSRNSGAKDAAHEPRPLDEVGERGGEVRRRPRSSRRPRRRARAPLEDANAARLAVRLDEAAAQLLEVVVGARDREIAAPRGPGARRCGRSGRDAEELDRHDLSRPSRATTPRTGRTKERVALAPAHRLGKRQRRDDARHDLARGPRPRPARDRLAGGDGRGRAASRRRRGPRRRTFCAFANPSAAFVGLPSARRRWTPAARGPRRSGPPASPEARAGSATSRRGVA